MWVKSALVGDSWCEINCQSRWAFLPSLWVLTNGLRMWGHFPMKDCEEVIRLASLGKESPGQSLRNIPLSLFTRYWNRLKTWPSQLRSFMEPNTTCFTVTHFAPGVWSWPQKHLNQGPVTGYQGSGWRSRGLAWVTVVKLWSKNPGIQWRHQYLPIKRRNQGSLGVSEQSELQNPPKTAPFLFSYWSSTAGLAWIKTFVSKNVNTSLDILGFPSQCSYVMS